MTNISLTKVQAVVLTIWACVGISVGAGADGYLADILLVFSGAMIFAAMILPTNTEKP